MLVKIYCSKKLRKEVENAEDVMCYDYATDDMCDRYYYSDDENYDDLETFEYVGEYDDSLGYLVEKEF